jgi:hypothetical protein
MDRMVYMPPPPENPLESQLRSIEAIAATTFEGNNLAASSIDGLRNLLKFYDFNEDSDHTLFILAEQAVLDDAGHFYVEGFKAGVQFALNPEETPNFDDLVEDAESTQRSDIFKFLTLPQVLDEYRDTEDQDPQNWNQFIESVLEFQKTQRDAIFRQGHQAGAIHALSISRSLQGVKVQA